MHWPLCQQVFVFLFFCRFFVALAGAPVQQIPRSSELLTAENWESHVPHGWWYALLSPIFYVFLEPETLTSLFGVLGS